MWMIEAVQIQVYTGHGECRVSHLDARRQWPAAGIELHARTLVPNVLDAPRRQADTLQPLPPGPIMERKAISRSTSDGDSAACKCKHARLVSTWIQVQLLGTCTAPGTSSHHCETQHAEPSHLQHTTRAASTSLRQTTKPHRRLPPARLGERERVGRLAHLRARAARTRHLPISYSRRLYFVHSVSVPASR